MLIGVPAGIAAGETRVAVTPETALERLEDHMLTYRQSAEREQWRAIVSPFYGEPPKMEHFTIVTQS